MLENMEDIEAIEAMESISRLPAEERYTYFIDHIADNEEVWGLYHHEWATLKDEDGHTLLPLWPRKMFAERCAGNEWKDHIPLMINVHIFLKHWIPGMKEDEVKLAVFMTLNDPGLRVDTGTFVHDLNQRFATLY